MVMKFYIVTMYRWGERDNHSYVLGVFDDEQEAIRAGKEHGEHRGGKYDPEVIETEIGLICMGERNDSRTILPIYSDKS